VNTIGKQQITIYTCDMCMKESREQLSTCDMCEQDICDECKTYLMIRASVTGKSISRHFIQEDQLICSDCANKVVITLHKKAGKDFELDFSN